MAKIGDVEFTGFENQKVCSWCGGALPKRRRSWCCDEHYLAYWQAYNWNFASKNCRNKADNSCEACGKLEKEIPLIEGPRSFRTGLEVHHIEPINGGGREWSNLNCGDNLIALCHDCHAGAHRNLRY